ncbi:hypothetical protein GCM10010472_55620 [Pseudonocardia halophobica]|uniref:Uncharacterized protein n=1 Tax=Pseudonocardia halophobica TaxID=29401 RepID=A0A9W6NWG3_9PSEU|nr:hypothetical protein GCM10017577_27790 [Pseudonocardia halophobica]
MLVGAVSGLAWAAALRAFMVEVAGPASTFGWIGTFEGILLPGAVAGGLLGWAEHLRRTGRHHPWLAAAPLVFVLFSPWVVVSMFVDGGLGGGALAVPLFGMAGGYALAGRGSRPARWAAGAFALVPVPTWLVAASAAGLGPPLGSARGAWTAVLFLSLLAVLSLGCALPHRGPPDPSRPAWRLVVAGAVCGLAWGAGMRGFMAAVAEPVSTVSWFGTFGVILPAATIVGGLFGLAEHRRRTGGRARWRRLALSPLVFGVDPGALVLVLPAMAGGYALSGRGSRRGRWSTGSAALLPVPAYLLVVHLLDDIGSLLTPHGAWASVLLFSCYAVLVVACAIPHRAVGPGTGPARTAVPAIGAVPGDPGEGS